MQPRPDRKFFSPPRLPVILFGIGVLLLGAGCATFIMKDPHANPFAYFSFAGIAFLAGMGEFVLQRAKRYWITRSIGILFLLIAAYHYLHR